MENAMKGKQLVVIAFLASIAGFAGGFAAKYMLSVPNASAQMTRLETIVADHVTTKTFSFGDGVVRGMMYTDAGGAHFDLRDPRGNPQLIFSVDNYGVPSVWDASGRALGRAPTQQQLPPVAWEIPASRWGSGKGDSEASIGSLEDDISHIWQNLITLRERVDVLSQ